MCKYTKTDFVSFIFFRFWKMESSQKSMELQHQVKNNANELNDFLRGLGSWKAEMQAKDEQLLEAARIRKEKELENTPSSRKLKSPPLVRASKKSEQNKTKKKSKELSSSEGLQEKGQKLKAYDYAAWDKFDVDTACAEVDNTDQANSKTKQNASYKENEDSDQPLDENDDKGLATKAKQETERNQKLINKQQAIVEKDKGNEYFKVRNGN